MQFPVEFIMKAPSMYGGGGLEKLFQIFISQSILFFKKISFRYLPIVIFWASSRSWCCIVHPFKVHGISWEVCRFSLFLCSSKQWTRRDKFHNNTFRFSRRARNETRSNDCFQTETIFIIVQKNSARGFMLQPNVEKCFHIVHQTLRCERKKKSKVEVNKTAKVLSS